MANLQAAHAQGRKRDSEQKINSEIRERMLVLVKRLDSLDTYYWEELTEEEARACAQFRTALTDFAEKRNHGV